MTLVGAESVQQASCTIRSAASEMSHAAESLRESLEAHQRFLDSWLERFSEVLKAQEAGREG